MRNIKKAQSIVGHSKNREPYDHYPTPAIAVVELLKRESFCGVTWEPCCGSGNIAKYFTGGIYSDIRTDNIYDKGEGGVDFLETNKIVDNIVTNPPYSLALPFVEHALECATTKVAMLCKLVFLEGGKRYNFFKEYPPSRIWVFSNRLPIVKAGDTRHQSSMLAFAWFVWDIGKSKNLPVIDWIMIKNAELTIEDFLQVEESTCK